jgi:hypothetical protein
MRVFIAGPLTAADPKEQEANVERAMAAGYTLLRAGHDPFIPHLSHYFDRYLNRTERPIAYRRWLQWSMQWIGACDCMLCLGPSPGTDQEVALARQIGIPVFSSITELLLRY